MENKTQAIGPKRKLVRERASRHCRRPNGHLSRDQIGRPFQSNPLPSARPSQWPSPGVCQRGRSPPSASAGRAVPSATATTATGCGRCNPLARRPPTSVAAVFVRPSSTAGLPRNSARVAALSGPRGLSRDWYRIGGFQTRPNQRKVRRTEIQWPRRDLNPHGDNSPRDFKSRASASFATRPTVTG